MRSNLSRTVAMPVKKSPTKKQNLYLLPLVKSARERAAIFSCGTAAPEKEGDRLRAGTHRKRDVKRYLALTESLPDVRAEKVARLREAVRNKTYHVDAIEIVEKILSITPEMTKF